ncbi:MAG: GGDEF domain-containing protein [Raoultibacter sp.]
MNIFNVANMEPFIKEQIEKHPPLDLYRLVDVDSYIVYDYRNGELVALPGHCYDTWNRGLPCRNCISRICIAKNSTVFKLETVEGEIFLVNSTPMQVKGKTFALELARKVTEDLLVANASRQENVAVTELIEKINDMAIRDLATGLYNKHFAEEQLARLVGEWTPATSLIIAVIDIDKFKTVNDTYGHIAGDNVIARLADLLTACAEQGGGWASRLGGDEFMLCFSGLEKQRAVDLIEEFLDRFRHETFGWKGNKFHASISIGITQFQSEMGNWLEFLNKADQAMYSSKAK